VFGLLALAPWTAECSWGGFTADDFLLVVVYLAPLYGCAAVLIREVARRTGGGWPVIVLLSAAFGVFQAGLVDQSLFNPDYLDDTQFAAAVESADQTRVPGLGVSASQAFGYVGNHIALSISAPIAIVESFVEPDRRYRNWLGRGGLAVIGVVYVLGCLMIFTDAESGRKGYMAGPRQSSLTVLVTLALVCLAMLPRWRRTARRLPGSAPHPLWVGLVSLFAYLSVDVVPGWAGLALQVAVVAAVASLIVVWTRRTGWDQRHVLAAWGAGLLVAGAYAYIVPTYDPASPAESLIGDLATSAVTLTLLGMASWRLRRSRRVPCDPA
jgi:hypothetical protein